MTSSLSSPSSSPFISLSLDESISMLKQSSSMLSLLLSSSACMPFSTILDCTSCIARCNAIVQMATTTTTTHLQSYQIKQHLLEVWNLIALLQQQQQERKDVSLPSVAALLPPRPVFEGGEERELLRTKQGGDWARKQCPTCETKCPSRTRVCKQCKYVFLVVKTIRVKRCPKCETKCPNRTRVCEHCFYVFFEQEKIKPALLATTTASSSSLPLA